MFLVIIVVSSIILVPHVSIYLSIHVRDPPSCTRPNNASPIEDVIPILQLHAMINLSNSSRLAPASHPQS